MTKLFTFYKWKDYKIIVQCSNEHCEINITMDGRQLKGFMYCSIKCLNKQIVGNEK